VQYVESGRWWAQTMLYGLTFLKRDGEKIILLFMLLLVQNHGKMYMWFKIVVIELECKFSFSSFQSHVHDGQRSFCFLLA